MKQQQHMKTLKIPIPTFFLFVLALLVFRLERFDFRLQFFDFSFAFGLPLTDRIKVFSQNLDVPVQLVNPAEQIYRDE